MSKSLSWTTVVGVCASVLLIGLGFSNVKLNSAKANTSKVDVKEDPTDTSIRGTNLPNQPLDERDVFVEKKHIKHILLTESNTVALVGAIGPESLNVIDQLNEKARHGKEIYLIINSPGGSVLDGALIVSAVQASKVPVHTVCLQICASMAAIIHQYGKERYMVDRSHLMFHEAAGGIEGQFNQLRSRFNEFSRFTNKMDYEIAQRIGISYEEFRSKLADEIWIDAEDAIAQHFTDRIVSVEFDRAFNDPAALALLNKFRSQSNTFKNKIRVTGE